MQPRAPPNYFTVLEAAMKDPDFARKFVRDLYFSGEDVAQFGMMAARDPGQAVEAVKTKARRKKSKYSRALSQELKKINKQARTKSGKLRKGMTQKKILAKAHRAVKRRLK
jgi:hypothetical protein